MNLLILKGIIQILNHAFQQNSKVVVPEQLSVWRQHKALQNNVCDAENRLKQSEEMLQQLMDKIETRSMIF